MGAERNRGLILCLLGIGILFVATTLAYRLPPPLTATSPHAFSAYRARAELETLVGDGVAHPIGSTANARLRDAILLQLSQLGYETEVQSGFVCNKVAVCAIPSNIIARLHRDGAQSSDHAVLLAAHYDSVPAGPGASDDAAGVATILQIAQILKTIPPTRHPIVLLVSDGEEAGLLGATLFVRDHPLAKTIDAAVNLEARGSSGASLMFETGSANSWLMSLYRSAIARPITDSVFYVAYKTLQNDTDFSVFKSAGWQGFNFAYIGDVRHYHTPLDNVAHADVRSVQHQGDNALASVLALANSDAGSAPRGDAVYFDLFARALIKWPARDSVIAAVAILASLLLETSLLRRHGRVNIRQISWGCIGVIASLTMAGAAGIATWLALVELGKVPPLGQYSWIAHPAWMNMVCAALAAGAAAGNSVWLAKRAGFWGFWAAAVLLTAASALLQAALRPGLCFVSLLSAGTAVIAVVPALRARAAGESCWRADIAALAPAWVLFALMLPLASLLYGAIGSIAWPIDTLLFSLGAMLLLPLLAAATARLRRGIVLVSTALSFIGVTFTLLLPAYSQASPQRLNFAYVLDQDSHSAFWVAQPDSMKLPAALAQAAAFEKTPRPLYPGSGIRGFYAIAPWSSLPAPQLTLRAAIRQADGSTRYELHLHSPRGAPEIEVAFPSVADVREIILAGASGEQHVPLSAAQDGMTRLHVVGLPQGLDFAVNVHGGSLEARLVDRSYTLPGGEFLQRLRSPESTSSQDGDTTVVHHTVVLDPAAGR